MTKYNSKSKVNSEVKPTVTHQGGQGFSQKPEHELVGILSTGLDKSWKM